MFRSLPSCLALISLLWTVSAQVIPFQIDGYLDAGSAKASGTAFNSGGSVSIQGNQITIPSNLQVQFPNAIVPWVNFTSGTLDPGAHEVIINGNIVNGVPIAAQFQISGNILQFSTGVISAVNTDGSITLESGPTLRINDPTGKFGPAFTGLPLFTVDPVNPTITSFGGFPMCVPRSASDPQCPSSNRPAGTAGNNFIVSDPLHMVPFRAGDFLTYMGVEFNGEILVYNIVANVGIYSESPGFIVVETINIAPIDATNNAALEAGSSRFTGYTTSDKAIVSVFALHADPCTGALTEQLITTVTPERTPVQGRYQWDVQKPVFNGPYTQSYRFTLSTGQITTSDGIVGGTYDNPALVWIWPEVITPGAVNPPLNFGQLDFLANGFGPDPSGNVFHQLSPWPGSPAPTPSQTCPDKIVPPTPPPPGSNVTKIPLTVTATSVSVLPGVQVSITATQTQPNVTASDLTFAWTEVSPTETLALTGANTATLSFVVPAPQTPATLVRTFQVICTHVPTGSTANTTVTVTGDKSKGDTVVIDSYTIANKQAGTVSVVAHTNLVGDSTATMTVSFQGGAAQAMTNVGPGEFQFTQSKFGQTAESITVSSVTSDKVVRGTATLSTLTGRKRSRVFGSEIDI